MATDCSTFTRIGRLTGGMMLTVAMAACSATPQFAPEPHAHVAQLTPSPYKMTSAGSRITVQNDESATNNREIYWNSATPESSSAEQCATWTFGSGIAQNGLAFRIATQSGGYNAVVLVRNIFVNMYWVFSPKMFHTGEDYETDWDSREADGLATDLSDYLGEGADDVWPIRVCASLDSDDMMCFAVAKMTPDGFDRMPPLANPGIRGGCWELNMDEFYHFGEGANGVNGGTFVGHIPTGTSLIIENTTLDGQPAPLPDS